MLKRRLNEYIGCCAAVTLFDGSQYRGYLYPTGREYFDGYINLALKPGGYILVEQKRDNAVPYREDGNRVVSPVFRCSHVTKIRRAAYGGLSM